MIRSLSINARRKILELGRTMRAAYAYDNFDVNLKPNVPLIEKTTESLKHLTSGLIFPLQHGITRDDLKCSEELWRKSRLNPDNVNISKAERTYVDLLKLHQETLENNQRLTRREEFISYLCMRDLIAHGPEYFNNFTKQLKEPDVIEAIPVVKTDILPVYAMEINNSTTSGNIQAIDKMLEQGGIVDPDEILEEDYHPDLDITGYVVLIHGDLGTGERVSSVLQRRSIEDTPWDRKQHVIFIPGLFHSKMACADAIHRTFIKPSDSRLDDSGLMQDVHILRPNETGILTSKPGFRRMHQVINHSGICRRLDMWRVHAQHKNPDHASLELFAESKPTFEDLTKMANDMAQEICCASLPSLRLKEAPARDEVQENALLMHKYLALYEEFSYAMNQGDIGRVETCLVAWIPLFRATGKHKYATHLEQFLLNVHFEYPGGLR